jgi:hypothetical protein
MAQAQRFGPVVLLALAALAMATRESSLPFVLGRYSMVAFALLVATLLLALAALSIALRERDPRRSVATTLTLLLSCGFSAFLAEGVFRTFFLENKVPESDAEFAEMIARDWPEPRSFAPVPGRLRILGLSDSFGRAGGDANYHYVLERSLRAAGHEVEVVNVSVTALSPKEELDLLERYGERFRPDIVLHGVFTGNDLTILDGTIRHFRRIMIREHSGPAAWHPRRFTLIQALDGLARVGLNELELSRDREAGAAAGTFSERSFLKLGRASIGLYERGRDPRRRWVGARPSSSASSPGRAPSAPST